MKKKVVLQLADDEYKKIAEAALFVSGRSMTDAELAKVLGIGSIGYVKNLMDTFAKEYNSRNSSLEIKKDGESYSIGVRHEYTAKVAVLAGAPDISHPSLRMLAYISKNEPVMQSALVKAFGSSTYEHMKELSEKGFVLATKTGRTKKIETTQKFREYFEL